MPERRVRGRVRSGDGVRPSGSPITAAVQRYRATGADLPFGNPLAAHGVSMEGYFWRFTDPASSHVIIALVGVNQPDDGPSWATVGIAAEPEGILRTTAAPGAAADPAGLGAAVDGHVQANPERVRFRLGDVELDVRIRNPRLWPRRLFGGSSYFHLVPGLNQYWHPWLLGGQVDGAAVLAGQRISLDGWRVYGEKNWGRGGFPEAWWWGQAQGFADDDACVAFAGGRITAGPTVGGRRCSTEVTALVVVLPGGRVLRLGNPVTSPVRADVQPGRWRLRGRSLRWQVEVGAAADPADAFVLPVPLVAERRNAPGDIEHLAAPLRVRVLEYGREVWRGETRVAAVEVGGRELAEAELARRGGDPQPRRG